MLDKKYTDVLFLFPSIAKKSKKPYNMYIEVKRWPWQLCAAGNHKRILLFLFQNFRLKMMVGQFFFKLGRHIDLFLSYILLDKKYTDALFLFPSIAIFF